MKNKFKNKIMYKTRIFLIIFVVTIIPLIILSIYSYMTYINGVSNKIDVTTKSTLVQLDMRVENVMDSIRAYYAELETQDEFNWLNNLQKNDGYTDYIKLNKVADLLKGPVYLRDYIDSFIYVDYKQNIIFCNKGIIDMDQIQNMDEVAQLFQEDSDSKILWRNNLDMPSQFIFSKNNEMSVDGYMMILGFPLIDKESNSYLIVRFNRSRLYGLIAQGLGDLNAVVTDQNGTLVYGTDTELTKYCLTNLNTWNDESGIISAKLSSKDTYRITNSVSQTSGLHYFVGYNRSVVSEGAQKIISLSVVLLAGLAFVFILMFVGTKIIYKPVYAFKKDISTYIEEEGQGDEFTFFRRGLEVLADSNNSLETMVGKQKRVLEELFMHRMVHGELNIDKINQNLKEFHIVPQGAYQILALKIELFEESGTDDLTQMDAFRLTVIKEMPMEILNQLFLPPISHANAIIFIIGASTDEELQTAYINQQVREFITEQFPCFVISGASRIFHKLTHLRTAFNESIEALKNIRGQELGNVCTEDITFYGDLINEQEKISGYDVFYEKAVYEAIDNRDAVLACKIMNQFVDSLVAKKISVSDRSYFLNRFLLAIFRVATDAGLSMVQIFETEQINLIAYFSQLYDDRKIRNFYEKNIIYPVTDKLVEFRRNHSTGILDQVMDLVKETNGDITLAECADKLNYHPSYIWKVLKTEKNMTFTDFIALEKLEMAKDMLINTDMSISQIAEKLNYTNTQNFIRFFNKHEHISPGKYKASLEKQFQ